MESSSCPICLVDLRDAKIEPVYVRSNVRAFRDVGYAVWRCDACLSIHAADAVDLDKHYEQYPFHQFSRDPRLLVVHSQLLRRLRRAGLRKNSSILDYGCGSGAFVEFLRDRGFSQAFGYDAYNSEMRSPSRLRVKYDVVLAQDVVEHAEAPLDFLKSLDDVARPGGLIVIGTPDAEKIDLARPKEFLHTLHAPYHRHLFSRRALERATVAQGWTLLRRYSTMYTNTLVPFLNEAFYRFYAGLFDDTLDALFGPVDARALLRNLPRTLWFGLLGAFASRQTDPMSVFRKS